MVDEPPADDATAGHDLALAAALYEDLRAAARAQLAGERSDHTLQPTALAHEAWLRLARHRGQLERTRFLAAAAKTIRRVLIDHARARHAVRRGGGAVRVTLPHEPAQAAPPLPPPDVLALDDALRRLATFAPEQADLVELRFFGGLDQDELARALDVSVSTVERRWRLARAWLRRELEGDGP